MKQQCQLRFALRARYGLNKLFHRGQFRVYKYAHREANAEILPTDLRPARFETAGNVAAKEISFFFGDILRRLQ